MSGNANSTGENSFLLEEIVALFMLHVKEALSSHVVHLVNSDCIAFSLIYLACFVTLLIIIFAYCHHTFQSSLHSCV